MRGRDETSSTLEVVKLGGKTSVEYTFYLLWKQSFGPFWSGQDRTPYPQSKTEREVGPLNSYARNPPPFYTDERGVVPLVVFVFIRLCVRTSGYVFI